MSWVLTLKAQSVALTTTTLDMVQIQDRVDFRMVEIRMVEVRTVGLR